MLRKGNETLRIEDIKLSIDPSKPCVFMGIGAPGSGKTYILEQLANEFDIPRIGSDDIREELTGSASSQHINRQVFEVLNGRVEKRLQSGLSVIVDATHAEAWRRPNQISAYRNMGANTVIGIWITADFATCLHRNAERNRIVPELAVRKKHNALENMPPSAEEGFDEVVIIENN